jgi:hypothetical protein
MQMPKGDWFRRCIQISYSANSIVLKLAGKKTIKGVSVSSSVRTLVTAQLPLNAPAIARAVSMPTKVLLNPKKGDANATEARPMTSTGRRPMRSLSLFQETTVTNSANGNTLEMAC